MRFRRTAIAACLLVAGCTAAPAPPAIAWTAVTLPADGPVATLDAAYCAGVWWVVGGRLGPGDATRPAAWTSGDGRTWRSVAFKALPGSLYGPQDLISSVGCADGRVAMIGAKPGGAHGIPRISTWRLNGGAMAEVSAPFDTYGGDSAVDVTHIAAGPAGFLITGDRTSGAAVWLSADGTGFRLIAGAPGLASDATAQTVARDAVAAGGQWVIVGGGTSPVNADERPAVWLTRDGTRFTRAPVPAWPGRSDPPGQPRYVELQRVVRIGAGLVAAGPRGDRLGAWRGPDWQAAGAFGTATDGVQSLTVAGAGRLIATSAGTLWRSDDDGGTWRPLAVPARAGDRLAVAGGPHGVLLAGAGRVWTAPQ